MTAGYRGREWPLVLGLVVAALLVCASMRVAAAGNHTSPPPKPKGNGVTGLAAAPVPAPAASASAPKAARRHRAHSSTGHAAAKHSAARHAGSGKSNAKTATAAPKASSGTAESTGSTGGSAEAPPKPHHHTTVKHPSRSSQPSHTSTPAPTQPPPALSVPGKSGQTTVGGVTFTVRSPTHFPLVGAKWAISASAARGGSALTGTVKMDVVYQGKVAAHMATGKLSGGTFAKKVSWPARSAGYPITVKVQIFAGGKKCVFLYDLKIRTAS